MPLTLARLPCLMVSAAAGVGRCCCDVLLAIFCSGGLCVPVDGFLRQSHRWFWKVMNNLLKKDSQCWLDAQAGSNWFRAAHCCRLLDLSNLADHLFSRCRSSGGEADATSIAT